MKYAPNENSFHNIVEKPIVDKNDDGEIDLAEFKEWYFSPSVETNKDH